jgi:hypothetical protein
MSHLLDPRCLLGRIAGGNFADVCENITFKQTALGSCGGNFGDFGVWDALLEEEGADGWVERVAAWGLGEG